MIIVTEAQAQGGPKTVRFLIPARNLDPLKTGKKLEKNLRKCISFQQVHRTHKDILWTGIW